MFGLFSKIKNALSKTRIALVERITNLFKGPLDEKTFEQLEQILYEADLGSECALHLVEEIKSYVKKNQKATIEEILTFLHQIVLEMLTQPPKVFPKQKAADSPYVILIVGVNGSGKTTSMAKLGYYLKKKGEKVLLAAGDTFRAAAVEQLTAWAERLDLPLIKAAPGADPASVAFDAIQATKARNIDTLLIDTAGRLQNKTDLMHELEKILRVIQKSIPNAPHEILLVLDATTGQNAIDQAEVFHTFTPLTGIILAKLDGSAKGGIVLSIYKKFKIPVKWVGVGERKEDIEPFDKKAYTDALLGK